MSGAAKRLLQLQLTRAAADANGETDGLEATLLAAAQSAPIRVRVGVHGGMANVGNMGCVQRLSYTALGDAVNTASRLEGFVKHMQGPCEIICGATVVNEAHPAILARYVGPVRLVGKHDTIDVCQVLGATLLSADEVLAFRRILCASAASDSAESRAECAVGAVRATGRSQVYSDSGADVDAAVATYLSEYGFDLSYDSTVLQQMYSLNGRIHAAHAAAAAWRAAASQPKQQPSTNAPQFGGKGGSSHALASQAAVDESVYAVEECYHDLPTGLRALFTLEDSLACVYSPTGAIECSSK
jgi:hypothetical protein